MLAIKINDKHTEECLAGLARKQGKCRQAVDRDVIARQIADAEDYQAAVEAKRRLDTGESKVISSEEIWRRLDLGH